MAVVHPLCIVLEECNWCHSVHFSRLVNDVISHRRILSLYRIVPLCVLSVASDVRASNNRVYLSNRLSFSIRSLISLPWLSSSSVLCLLLQGAWSRCFMYPYWERWTALRNVGYFSVRIMEHFYIHWCLGCRNDGRYSTSPLLGADLPIFLVSVRVGCPFGCP